MFDISWTEFLLIGVVALVVIGPKELPGVMRTVGQWTRKLRGMANEFQSQFQEAMREAEMADLKKEVDGIASDIKNYNPLKGVRDDIETAGKDIEKSFSADPASDPAAKPLDLTPAAVGEAVSPPETPAVTAPEPTAALPAPEPAAAAPEPAVDAPEPAVVVPESTERTG